MTVLLLSGGRLDATFYGLLALSLVLGVTLVLPIGGADMPVVISLLNSFTGCAAGLAGFVLGNTALLIGGGLVGASGLILTLDMCKAMNRPLSNVIFGAFGSDSAALSSGGSAATGTVRSYSVEDAAIIFSSASSVIIVPGYGMAVAQAQHVVKELAAKLAEKGIDVKYAIHPVAGRMPGHMNVLLAEADVPYEQLYDLDEINAMFPETDVALVIGANDVVNPAARYDKSSPIYGMPILDVDKARTVIVSKRSMSPGFAGIDNELFLLPNTIMVFGNAKTTIAKLVSAVEAI
jgi:NAD(P) transhydrogenase subunit beta